MPGGARASGTASCRRVPVHRLRCHGAEYGESDRNYPRSNTLRCRSVLAGVNWAGGRRQPMVVGPGAGAWPRAVTRRGELSRGDSETPRPPTSALSRESAH
ncbi:hypothetical protein EVAR_24029_1 [Eumeta japonica]|uniref:Uncharacterized protein n=1 Tax=Eumeta variegata TaxID=151549 RepID=A0A4C1W8T7_EUMVA|nr:hypothetical protein EVAR_24029_1 [Eumeta japonica]